MCDGAHEMDEHFATAPFERNLPVVMALLGVWYGDFFGAGAHAVLPYDMRLERFPDYLQQLEMESNGKRVTREGEPVDYATCPVVWGAPGHQRPARVLPDAAPGHAGRARAISSPAAGRTTRCREHHAILLANFFAQTEALMRGKSAEEVRAEHGAAGTAAAGDRAAAAAQGFPGQPPEHARSCSMRSRRARSAR